MTGLTLRSCGRRIEKSVDGRKTSYAYDGGHVLAEYDGNGNQLRKYIYGPGTDSPICMIEVADSNAAYYYHADGLGSIVALSDADGDTVQTYEYSIYGQVAASDPNHPNPYMFTGRRFDVETGLYYYRARMYDAHTGRFLQTDPIGYQDGINWYAYCRNNPGNFTDPSGCSRTGFMNMGADGRLNWAMINDDGTSGGSRTFGSIESWISFMKGQYSSLGINWQTQIGGQLANGNEDAFWAIQVLIQLDWEHDFALKIKAIEDEGVIINTLTNDGDVNWYDSSSSTIDWAQNRTNWNSFLSNVAVDEEDIPGWYSFPSIVLLGHELAHAYDDKIDNNYDFSANQYLNEISAMRQENVFRYLFFKKIPGFSTIDPRPCYGYSTEPSYLGMSHAESALHPDITWSDYWGSDEHPHTPY